MPSGGFAGALVKAVNAQQQPTTTATPNPNVMAPDQAAQALGMTPQDLNALVNNYNAARAQGYGGSLSNYLTLQSPQALYNQQTVTTPEEAAQAAALAQLTGQATPFISPAQLQPGGQPNVTFNPAQAQSDIAAFNSYQAQQKQGQQALQQQQQGIQQAAGAAEKQQTITGVASGAMLGFQVGGPIGAAVGGVLGGIFCFASGTPILMADGSLKNVEDITIGDNVALGGFVYAVGKQATTEVYKYRGTYVSPSHVVFNNGMWSKVKDLNGAEEVPLEQGKYVVVHPIVCEDHLLVSNGYISADFALLDDPYEMTESQRIEVLNNNTERNKDLTEKLAEISAAYAYEQAKE